MQPFETVNEALIACVKAAGGSKQVGHKLWPEKAIDAAQRHLLACLNEDKPERLTPEQVLLVADMARAAGCHAYMDHCSARLHYASPQPVAPADEVDQLRREYIEAARSIGRLAQRIEQAEQRLVRVA